MMPIIHSLLLRGFLLIALICFAPTAQSWAQDAAPASQPAAANHDKSAVEWQQLEELVGTLENPAERDQFLNNLKALIAAHKQTGTAEDEPEMVDIPPPETLGARAIFAISSGIRTFSEGILEGVSVFKQLPNAGNWVHAQLSERQSRNFWLGLITKLLLVVIGGYAMEWITSRVLQRPGRRLEAARPAHMSGRVLLVAARAALDLLPIAAFAVAAYVLLPLAGSGDRARFVVLAVVNSHILVCLTLAVARMLLMPTAPNLRLLRISDETAIYLYIWVRRLSALVIYGYFFAAAAQLLGMDPAGKDFLLKLIGLMTVAMLIVLVLQNRKTVADWLRGRVDASGETATAIAVFRRRLADVWHLLVAIYLAAFYLVWVLNIGFVFLLRATLLTLVVLLVARLLIAASSKAVDRAFRVGHEFTMRYPGLEARANRYLPVLARVLRIVIYVVAGLLILQAWGVESLDWLTSRDGVRFIGTGLGIIVVLTIALILWEMVSLALDRYAARIDATSRSSARVRTLLPLLRTIILVVLSVMVGLVVLSQIGINITPLLAGAGVIGLAVGFGSQKLVQDVINGLFILAEDTVSIGDVVKIDDNAGVVEEIKIRNIRLRDASGSVITVPFSEVKTIINMSRDYGKYVFDISVAYKENVDEVFDILKKLDEEFRKDARFASLIVAPLEIVGVEKFTDSAVIVRALYTTLPTKQWDVGREFNRRIKKRFDEMDIDFSFPTLTVYKGDMLGAVAESATAGAGAPAMASAKPA